MGMWVAMCSRLEEKRLTGGMLERCEKVEKSSRVAAKGIRMVCLGIRSLIGRISRRLSSASTTMVYSYSLPFESTKLKVSDIHSLQSVLSSPFFGSVLD